MKGEARVIAVLNEILTGELTAISQYFLHARMCKDWGYSQIAKKVYEESIDEMRHAQSLIDRILFLEGLPNIQNLGSISIGETVHKQLKADLALEMDAIPKLRKGIELCYDAKDHVSRKLLEKILSDEETHTDWIESQLHMIKEISIENYLAEQMKE